MKSLSLQGRVMFSAALVLLIFLGLTGWVLDKAFRDSVERALQGRLEGQLYGLLGVAEFIPGKGLQVTDNPPEPRFSRPGSGLIAQGIDAAGKTVWQSGSALGLSLPALQPLGIDAARFHRILIDGQKWFSYEYGLSWVDDLDKEHRYTFRITESPATFTRQLGAFRQTMITWFAFVVLMLMVVQAAILRWGLSPLRRIEHELKEVENGHSDRLGEDFPRELKGLARNLNLLISNERRHLERYRHTLADLAHSLKTPLAVLRSSASTHREDEQLATLVDEQVSSMTELVEYQLQKATMVGTTSVVRGVAVDEIVQRVVRSLRKVYQGKDIDFETRIDSGAEFFGESGDLMELLGNLLDNACKWCAGRVGISVRAVASGEWRNGLRIDVDDDGQGIDAQRVDEVLQRGVRGDSRVPGHGIGLAVVSEIVAAYGGDIQVARSDWGGARMSLRIDYSL